jgi:Xaa-Pro aminopeptidase
MSEATAPAAGFPVGELKGRTERTQRMMVAAGLDAMLFTTEPEVRYFTGYLTRFWESPTRPWFLVVPARGKPIAVIPSIGADLMSKTWLDDIRTWSAPDLEDDGVTLLVQTLREVAGNAGRIGMPMGHETSLRMPLADYARLCEAIAPRTVVDATAIVQALHRVKSEAEIAKIAHACSIAGKAFDGMASIARTGTPLTHVFRDFQVALLQAGADWVPYLAGGAGPGGYGDVISLPSARPLQTGDVLMLDTGAIHDGYFCDFDRNYAIGQAADESRRAYDTLYAATEAGLAAAKPGATCAKVFQTMNAVIATFGGADAQAGRIGHGLGMRLTEWPSLIPTDNTVLEPGMVMTLEPGLEMAPGRIMVHEENIVIRDAGAQLLSPRAAPHLPVLD